MNGARRFLLAAAVASCTSASERLVVRPAIAELTQGASTTLDLSPCAPVSVRAPPELRVDASGCALTITASPSARPGSYAIDLSAGAARARVTVVVDAASAFTLSADAASVPQGGSALIPLRVTRAPGFAAPIDVSASSASGLSFERASLDGDRGAVRVSASTLAPIGPSVVSILGESAGALSKIDVPVTVRPPGGALDTTFGKGGLYVESFNVDGQGPVDIEGLAQQPDGKLLVVGELFRKGTQYDVLVTRYDEDAKIDTSFGDGGVVLLDLGTRDYDVANAVAVQPDGKIVVVGNRGYTEAAVMRFDAKGALDPTFGAGGVFFGLSGTFYATNGVGLALQPDGKILFSGLSSNTMRLARLTKDGALDATFGNGGVVAGPKGTLASVAIAPSGDIVACGFDDKDWIVWRRKPDGSPDASFGAFGATAVDWSGYVDKGYSLAIDENGRYVIAGSVGSATTTTYVGLARLGADGALDGSFGQGGKLVVSPSGGKGSVPLAIQPDGALLVGGGSTYGGDLSMMLARVTPSGALDPSFGGTGRVFTAFGGNEQWARRIARLADGRVLALGYATAPIGNAIMARYWP